jgi:oligoendopeptidase F
MDEERQAELMEGYVPEEMLLGVLETVAHGLGGEIAQAYDFMRRNELCDLSMSDVKAEISFQTYLDDYDAPYLFAYPYGDREDIITVTHEFGHYAEAYISCGWYRSMDLAEVYSQAMQFLSIKPLEGVLGARDTAVLRLLNLYDALDTLVWQAVYAEFEERAFQMEDPTAEKLNALMEEISLEYGLTKEEAADFAPQWIDVTHFFEQPFYVISYPVSACCALEIYEKELTDGSGVDTYLRLAGSEAIGLLEATEEVGLHNPLSDARVQEVASLLDRLMGS